jgi:hypothetical protein
VNPILQIRDSGIGWAELIAAQPNAEQRFTNTPAALAIAIAFYFAIVIIALLLGGLTGAPLTAMAALGGVVINAVTLIALLLAVLIGVLILQVKVPPLNLMVPAVYAMGWLLLLGIVMSLLPVNFVAAQLGILAYMMYRAARVIAGLSVAFSIAFAVLCVVVLVALPLSLYMLMAPGPGPI